MILALWIVMGEGLRYRQVLFLLVLLALIIAPALLFAGAGRLLRSSNHPRWSAINWLPLRGRWLCWLLAGLLLIPAGLLTLVDVVLIVSLVVNAFTGPHLS